MTLTSTVAQTETLGPNDKIGAMWYYAPGPDGKPVPIDTNRHVTVYGTGSKKVVTIRDLRGRPDLLKELSLDVHGFELHHYPSIEKDFNDANVVRTVYYPECLELLKKLTGAQYVHIDTSLIRRDPFDKVVEHMTKDGTEQAFNAPRAPARNVHLDVSSREGTALTYRTLEALPEETQEKLRQRPFAIVNIWRPIKPIQRDPLALMDARSIQDDELISVPCSYMSPTGVGRVDSEMYKISPQRAAEHQWWYVSNMQPDEILVFKQFDSRSGVSGRVPHSSFVDEAVEGKGLPPRESIEIRAKVWF